MPRLLLLTRDAAAGAVLPALDLLPYAVTVTAPGPAVLLDDAAYDVVLVDARDDLIGARAMARMLRDSPATASGPPVIGVFNARGWAGVNTSWGLSDVIHHNASPAEVEARLRLATAAADTGDTALAASEGYLEVGDLSVDEHSWTARVNGRPLDLAFKEFELLRFLAAHPHRVHSRETLLDEVWGQDYYGGTRTVDVHVRRLRAKLGPEHDSLITTVRSVGYRLG